jgi:hypothetical protein
VNPRAWIPLLLMGALFSGACAGIALGGDLRFGGLPRALVLYFVAAGAQLGGLLWLARRGKELDARGKSLALILVVGVALVARLSALPSDPSLSEDAWRYRWEGLVQAEGVNPYTTPPADPSLAHLRDAGWLQVNHPEVAAIYGPPLQLAFRALAALPGSGLTWFKLAFLAADLGLLALLIGGLRRRGLDPLWSLVYAWHPLVVLEVVGQCHLEIVPIAFLAAAVELESRGRWRLAALALGTALASKYLPLLVLPAFLLLAKSWRGRASRLGWLLLPGALCALPYLSAGKGLVAGLGAYGARWSFNGVGFEVLDAGLQKLGISQALVRAAAPLLVETEGFDPALHQTWIKFPAKLVVIAIAGCVTLYFARRAHLARGRARRGEVLRAAALACGLVFLVGSPTVHPWYALWVVPFLVAADPRLRAPALLFTLLLPLVYEIRLRYTGLPGTWVERDWVRAAVWLPPALFALLGLLGPRVAPALFRGRLFDGWPDR